MREGGLVVGHVYDAGPDVLCRGAKNSTNGTIQHMSLAALRSTHRKILKIWSISESPGKRGCPRMTISAKIQPTDHMSIAVE